MSKGSTNPSASTNSAVEVNPTEILRLIEEKEHQKQKNKYDRYINSQQKRMLAESGEHKFWDTQPVPKLSEPEAANYNGPITTPETCDRSWYVVGPFMERPYTMPEGFEWSGLDLNDPNQLEETYKLLEHHYVEDDLSRYRLLYSKETLAWALNPPGYFPELIIGVRATKSNTLVALITGIPIILRVYDVEVPLVEINFLCVNKKLRSKRLAPVLIKEVSRRVALYRRRNQAIYTSVGPKLPTPFSTCKYWHRLLNIKKLIEVMRTVMMPTGETLPYAFHLWSQIGWWTLPQRSTMATEMKKYKLPPTPAHQFVLMQPEDLHQVYTLIMDSLSKCSLAQVFTVEELSHLLTPRPNVVSTFVLKDDKGEVTDVLSYYQLSFTVIGSEKHDKLNSVFSLYNSATSMSYIELITDAVIIAKNAGFDVYSFVNLNQNESVIEPLKCIEETGNLHYYFYNWKCPIIDPKDNGLVFL